MTTDLDKFDLIIFGDFGVLTNTPFRDRQPLAMLPGRVELLKELRQDRVRRSGTAVRYAVTGNKGGVAFGLQSEEQAEAEVRWTAEQIGATCYRVCFAHPTPAAGFEHYADPDELKRRKPAPLMLEEIIAEVSIPRERVLVVGTYADDCRAAQAGGLAWMPTGSFFEQSMTAEARAKEDFDPFLDADELP